MKVARLLLVLILIYPLVVYGDEGKPLECRIRAVQQGGDNVVKLKITLENVGEPPIRVMMPNHWYDMSAASMMGGWSFQFIGPDGKPAAIDWGCPPPSPKPLMLNENQMVLMANGVAVGMTIPLKGLLGDLERVSRIVVTYEVKENFLEGYFLKHVQWFHELRPRLWSGKVQSQPFDIAEFVANRPKKK